MKKIISFLLAASMLLTAQRIPALAEGITEGNSKESDIDALVNPVHHCTNLNDGTDTTDWSYVYFGSYPQTEVTGDALTEEITEAAYDEDGDAWVNGTVYRRISENDTNNNEFFGDSDYRYFKWERIKWRVLRKTDDTLFVVADEGLDCKNYNDEAQKSVTWETCTMRTWLNEVFYQMAFSSSEQTAIVQQTVVNEKNPKYGTDGNETEDNIYLLSWGEVTNPEYGFCDTYKTKSVSRQVKESEYAFVMGSPTSASIDGDYGDSCWWWLRTLGDCRWYGAAVMIDASGSFSDYGDEVNRNSYAVVPALNIDLSSDFWMTADDGTNGGKTVELFREQSISALNAYKKAEDYREEQQTELAEKIAAGITAIRGAEDEAGISSAFSAAKAAIDQIKTDAQLTAEELRRAKDESKDELDRYKNAADYREEQQTELAAAIAVGKAAIEAAENEADVQSALSAAKEDIDQVKTDAQLTAEETAEELRKTKEESKEELDRYKNVADYREEQKAELAAAIAAAKAAIEAAEDEAAVQEALAAAKAVIDKIKTNAQLALEEQKNSDITLNATAIKGKIKAKSKGFLVKWKKAASVTGYQIQYSTSKKFAKKTTKTKTVKKASKTKLTVKKLKADKKYYVRIRTYKIVNGREYDSAWSKAKSVKTKK